MPQFKVVGYRNKTYEFQFEVEADDLDAAFDVAYEVQQGMDDSEGDLVETDNEVIEVEEVE